MTRRHLIRINEINVVRATAPLWKQASVRLRGEMCGAIVWPLPIGNRDLTLIRAFMQREIRDEICQQIRQRK